MNSATISTTVRSVIARVLEEASFVFTDTMDEHDKPDPALWDPWGISLSFAGPQTGCFRVWAEEPFARTLAANMLGIDNSEEIGHDKVRDAFMEMTNIFVGNALTELFGETAVFSLGIPEKADDGLKNADASRPDAIWLSAEGLPVLAVMELNY